jgi:hypothetical protein
MPYHMRINKIFSDVSPDIAQRMRLCVEYHRSLTGTAPYFTFWNSYFANMHLRFNMATPCHRDSRGFESGFDALVPFGPFTEGAITIPAIGIQIEHRSGCLLFIRGKVLEHEVKDYDGASRTCLVLYTHRQQIKKATYVDRDGRKRFVGPPGLVSTEKFSEIYRFFCEKYSVSE